MTFPHAHATLLVPAAHPALPGHFPGRPIVPGVVLLDLAAEAARAAFGLGPLTGIARAKFTAPVMPDRPVALRLRLVAPLRAAIVCDAFTCEASFAPAAAATSDPPA
jgi:3-hydroxymyristoyl/3-hydroxydecanoyl-(acyl carrier protein) dehydratase